MSDKKPNRRRKVTDKEVSAEEQSNEDFMLNTGACSSFIKMHYLDNDEIMCQCQTIEVNLFFEILVI